MADNIIENEIGELRTKMDLYNMEQIIEKQSI